MVVGFPDHSFSTKGEVSRNRDRINPLLHPNLNDNFLSKDKALDSMGLETRLV